MEIANWGQVVSFLFGIANDCLVDVYDVGDYRKIILPMTVIRSFDAVLEPTKQAVLNMKKMLDEAGITDQDAALCSASGEAFCNSSPYTLSNLKSRTNQQHLKSDFTLYLDGFSANVQEIIRRFEFRKQIGKLSEHDIPGILISKFTAHFYFFQFYTIIQTLPSLSFRIFFCQWGRFPLSTFTFISSPQSEKQRQLYIMQYIDFRYGRQVVDDHTPSL